MENIILNEKIIILNRIHMDHMVWENDNYIHFHSFSELSNFIQNILFSAEIVIKIR